MMIRKSPDTAIFKTLGPLMIQDLRVTGISPGTWVVARQPKNQPALAKFWNARFFRTLSSLWYNCDLGLQVLGRHGGIGGRQHTLATAPG
eukprot:601843-Amphidinium_carterae.1